MRAVVNLGATILLAMPLSAFAQFESTPPLVADLSVAEAHEQPQPPDLTLLNFFTEGWAEPWTHRHRYTPDMALLRVTTNFMEREFRADYTNSLVYGNPKQKNQQVVDALIAYGVDRRLMLEVVGAYQWNVPTSGPIPNGAFNSLVTRFQLVDTEGQSYAFQFRVNTPNKGLGGTQTQLQYVIAGWQDVHQLIPALGRMGLYFSVQLENLQGPHAAGAYQNDLSYDLSLSETWTPASFPALGNFTTFLEAYATTYFAPSGKTIAPAGRTVFSLTPGVRFWFVPDNSFTFGVDLPVNHAPTYSALYRVNYIYNF
ncbi:MAG TPA: hypothetical protein VMK42_07255 [Anaeromyxobacteraceae bacterium]|nr:hypothetical protein [Anaeromyxobacteraceae bacterium]